MKTIITQCKECGKSFERAAWYCKNRPPKYCSKGCRRAGMRGKKNWAYKHGLWSKEKPIYWAIAKEHYPVMCNRCLSDNDLQVHHIDRNRKNNYYENLEFLCRGCHSREHNFIYNITKKSPTTSIN